MKNKFLITGGAGFIGSNLVDRLLKNGEEVYVIDNFDPYYEKEIKMKNIQHNLKNPRFHFFECDIRDIEKVQKIIAENNINKIVHLAAKVGVRNSIKNPLLYHDVNVRGTLNLLEICRKHNIESFIFGSSSSVYGINKKIPFSEDQPITKPISPYASSKISCEMFCFTYSHLYGIPITCLRFFTVYGPRQRPEMAIHKFTKLIYQGEEIEMYGDGSSKRDYTYITDVIDGIVNALNKNFKFEIFNLGNSKPTELGYLISLIESALNKKALIKKLPMQPGDVPITYADISKAKKLLNFNPKVTIEDGINKFVEWFKESI